MVVGAAAVMVVAVDADAAVAAAAVTKQLTRIIYLIIDRGPDNLGPGFLYRGYLNVEAQFPQTLAGSGLLDRINSHIHNHMRERRAPVFRRKCSCTSLRRLLPQDACGKTE